MRNPVAGPDFFLFFLSTHTVQLCPPAGLSPGSQGCSPCTAPAQVTPCLTLQQPPLPVEQRPTPPCGVMAAYDLAPKPPHSPV